MQCVRQLMEEKEEKFKKSLAGLKTRSSSIVVSTARLPSLHRKSLAKVSPKEGPDLSNPKLKSLASLSSPCINKSKVLILNGKLTSKEDIFETIKYFKSLSGNKSEIKQKDFALSFDKKEFITKQIGSLFKHFDVKNKGEVSFEEFLRAYYHNIRP
jgi:hypothetical protein